MTHRPSARTLAAAVAAVFLTAIAAPPSLAQIAPTTDIQVLELEYVPAGPSPGLDLRPGLYLLQLQRQPTGAFEGLLRGPRNEVVAERLQFSASSGCGAGFEKGAVLATRGVAGRVGLNLIGIEIESVAGNCNMQALIPFLGLTLPEKPPQFLECEPPVELDQMSTGPTTDPGPTCNIEKWEPPITAPRPDVKPGRLISLAGRSFKWVEVARLDASEASDFRDGRCVFDYAFAAENKGRARSAISDASLVLANRFGPALDARVMDSLAPGAMGRIQGQLALPPGIWQVFAHVDSSARIVEWDAQNNARSVIIEVSGSCEN
jgi:hypothetical protein